MKSDKMERGVEETSSWKKETVWEREREDVSSTEERRDRQDRNRKEREEEKLRKGNRKVTRTEREGEEIKDRSS